jgi:hypothetical protein
MGNKLIGILNTATNRAISDDRTTIFRELEDEYRSKTFGDAITYMIKNPEKNEDIADEVRSYLQEQDGTNKIFEIRAYDADGNAKINVLNKRSNVLDLQDKIGDYIDSRSLDLHGANESYDCLDMVVDLNTKVG